MEPGPLLDRISSFVGRRPNDELPYRGPDFEFPSKETYRSFKHDGSWLKPIMATPEILRDPRHQYKDSTPWDSWTLIERWGWRKRHEDQLDYRNLDGVSGLVGKSKGTEFVWNHQYGHVGEETSKGVEYPSTDALYANVFFPEKGVIMAEINESPQYKVIMDQTSKGNEWDDKVHHVPKLCHWSDLVYLTWKHVCTEEQRKKLHAICRQNVTNPVTKNILAYVLRKNFSKDNPVGRAPEWPQSRTITPDMEGFDAMLSTPNVRGIAWLLIQHHQESKLGGKKTISSLTTYTEKNTTGYFPNIIVELEDVKDAPITPKDKGKKKRRSRKGSVTEVD